MDTLKQRKALYNSLLVFQLAISLTNDNHHLH